MMTLVSDFPIKHPNEDPGVLMGIQVWSPRTKIKIRETIRKSLFPRNGIKAFRQNEITYKMSGYRAEI